MPDVSAPHTDLAYPITLQTSPDALGDHNDAPEGVLGREFGAPRAAAQMLVHVIALLFGTRLQGTC
jgi:hypothetical protein